ncbi:MAG: 4-aminobutyrate--2-oxoglutarate transaminase [Candidatus Eremiobacteraeota bacterium]|nr:4-aminobutyrate--2-oxoglutarate transaminase [Candidatus Eremiobacteraeota bacterium]
MRVAFEPVAAGLLQRRSAAVVRGVSSAHPVFVERAEGVRVWDADGREYLDFAAGIGTLNLGHRHPRVVAAVREQLERFTHTCFQVAQYEGYVTLAERLNRLAPGDFAKKTLLLSTGAEATENAVKIARHATGRSAIVAFRYGYHGRTLLALTMTGKVAPYRQNFGPWAPDVYHVPYPYPLHGFDEELCLSALQELFETEVSPQRVAAIIIEPVLGEGGFVAAPSSFLRALREIADWHGILLIADEVQTGFGRTGAMFAMEHSGVTADIVVVAKSLAGGLPLSAVIGRADVMDSVEPGGLGGTFAGNPLACAAALATLDVFEQEDLFARGRTIGAAVRAHLTELKQRHSAIAEVRGVGAMVAVELHDAPLDERGRNRARQIVDAACERGLFLLTAGPKGNTIRFLIPLVASDAEVESGLERFETACASVLSVSETRFQNS